MILIKSNPSMFCLTMASEGTKPLILESFKRVEFVVYLLSQRDIMGLRTKITRATGFTLGTKDGKQEQIELDLKKLTDKKVAGRNKDLLKNMQLNNFCNAIKCGYLDRLDSNWIGMKSWEPKLCVLTNIGLLYFSNPLERPQDLFPIIDCQIERVKVTDPEYTQNHEAVRFKNAFKVAVFRSQSRTEYEEWFRCIRELQGNSEEKRKELTVSDTNSLPQVQRKIGISS